MALEIRAKGFDATFERAETLVKLLLSLDQHEARYLFGLLNSLLLDLQKSSSGQDAIVEGMERLQRAIALRNKMREFIDQSEECYTTMDAVVMSLVTDLNSQGKQPSDVQ
ncbi:MAG: hypothetical protein Q9183_003430, partial [Haloplaca sp. 2 TL-2023]